MATLGEKLDIAGKEILELQAELHKFRNVNETNKVLKDERDSGHKLIKQLEQKLNDVKVITNAFIRVETTTKEVEVGNYRGSPTIETITVESQLLDILSVILETCEDNPTRIECFR